MKHIIKRAGHIDIYSHKKLFESIYATCLAVNESEQDATLTANKVCDTLESWLANKNEVTSSDLRHQAGKYLSSLNHHAGYLYLHHRIMW